MISVRMIEFRNWKYIFIHARRPTINILTLILVDVWAWTNFDFNRSVCTWAAANFFCNLCISSDCIWTFLSKAAFFSRNEASRTFLSIWFFEYNCRSSLYFNWKSTSISISVVSSKSKSSAIGSNNSTQNSVGTASFTSRSFDSKASSEKCKLHTKLDSLPVHSELFAAWIASIHFCLIFGSDGHLNVHWIIFHFWLCVYYWSKLCQF